MNKPAGANAAIGAVGTSLDALHQLSAKTADSTEFWQKLSETVIRPKAPVETLVTLSDDIRAYMTQAKGPLAISIPRGTSSRIIVTGGGAQLVSVENTSDFLKLGEQSEQMSDTTTTVTPVAGYGDCWVLVIYEGVPPNVAPADGPETVSAPYYWGYDKRYAQTYEAGGETWEAMEPNDVVTRFIDQLIPDKSIGRIIDLGCGEGRDSLWLADQGYDVTGVDVAAAALDRARSIAKAKNLTLRLLERDVCFLRGLAPESYDVALNMGCLHMMDDPEDRSRHLKRVFEVLKPGGTFVVNHCKENWLKGFWSVEDFEAVKDAVPGDVIPRRIRAADGSVKVVEMEVLHHKATPADALAEEFRTAGFVDIDILDEDYFTFGNSAVLFCKRPAQ
jgi:SAM-dependent methyltransferase